MLVSLEPADGVAPEERIARFLGLPVAVVPLGPAGLYRVDLPAGVDPAAVAAQLGTAPGVRYATPDQAIAAPVAPPQFLAADAAPGDWGLQRVGAPAAWRYTDGAPVVVAVLDTGVSPDHPDLAGRVLPGWNFVADNADARDDAGHGTFVAGIIAGRRDGGVTGVAPGALILPVKILDRQAVGSTADFVAGIVYAVDHGARVITIAASGIVDSQPLFDALRYAEERGAVVVAAAGNQPDGQWRYPAAAPSVLAVGASTPDDTVAAFSADAAFVDLVAPGVDVRSAWFSPETGNGYLTGGGTSAAAPFVAGAAALLLGLRPDLTPAAVRQILLEAAVPIDPPGIDARSGHGRLDVATALQPIAPVVEPATGRLGVEDPGTGPRLHFTASGFAPGEPATLWLTPEQGPRRVWRGLAADASGTLAVDLGPLSLLPEGVATATAVGQSGTVATAAYPVAPVAAHPAFAPIPPVDATPDRVYFPETGHSLSFGFKRYWEEHGGLGAFGYPISEEFTELDPATGAAYTVQYFERARFEYHPEFAGTPFEVSLGRVGAQLAPQAYPTAPEAAASVHRRYFPETAHTLGGAFLARWEAGGGLAVFGYPISEPFEEGGLLVQYFERARFEAPVFASSPDEVRLTRLGVALARLRGYLR
ncbi:MAG: S8 family serine peptidase [Sphaerobacter sp.]|nr:S8 family serine peptidase [Sphaerobacter sp.]